MIPAYGYPGVRALYISHSNRSRTTADRHRAGKAAIVALLSVSALLRAQDRGGSVIDELLETMRESTSVQARKVTELPSNLQGKLIAIAEFDDEEQRWQPMDSPQEFGMATNDRISVLGYDVGQDGFVEAEYVDITDRSVRSYTGVTDDRRLSMNLYDDRNDPEHIVLQIRIGPRQIRYLLLRPIPNTQ